jgi:mono/diheme cytochrome c family protein
MRIFAGLILALAALATPARAQDAVARGRYLAILGDCAGCHTRMNGPAFAGGLPFTAQFGTIYSTNITPNRENGIGNWTADQFYRALHDGIAADGTHLYPALPYIYFSRISRRDTDDLFAYLKTLKPVYQKPTPNKLIFPFNIRWGLTFWNWLYQPKAPPQIPAGQSPQWKRGEYLVNGLGHCAACHTPKDLLFGDVASRPLAGGVVDNWYAANLTGQRRTGLGKWSQDDLVKFLATGRNKYATAAGSMQEKVTLSTSHMTDEDRAAIATYLKTLPAGDAQGIPMPDGNQMASGEVVFVKNCKVCHAPPGQPDQPGSGPLPDYPKLAGDTLIMGQNPTTVLRIILQDAESPVTPNEHTTYSMPSFITLSDKEIADVATYIRNSWGNHADPVSRSDVRSIRAKISS